MTTAPMNGDDRHVTRRELREELARFKTELYGDMAGLINHVVDHIGKLREDLTYQIANAARVAAEEHRRELGVVDEKFRDIPSRVGLLERELDEHRRDPRAHGMRPRAPKRRPRS